MKGNGNRNDEGTDYAEEPADDAFAKAKQGKKHSGLTLIKKINQIVFTYKEIHSGAVNYLHIYSYSRKPFLIYDFATAPF